jgi:hypothetical protein
MRHSCVLHGDSFFAAFAVVVLLACGGEGETPTDVTSGGRAGISGGGAAAIAGNVGTSAGQSGSVSAAGTSSGGVPAAAGSPSSSGTDSGEGAVGGGGNTSGGAGTGGTTNPTAGAGGELPPVSSVENTGADCKPPPAPPPFSALPAIASLPDPFLMASGIRIASRSEWRCRRAEISAQMQHWVSGPKGAPPSDVSATFSGGKLNVVVTQGGNSITLSSTITTPSGAGPFPLMIGMNTPTGSLPSSIFSGAGVATMSFTSSQMGISDPINVTRGAPIKTRSTSSASG